MSKPKTVKVLCPCGQWFMRALGVPGRPKVYHTTKCRRLAERAGLVSAPPPAGAEPVSSSSPP